MLTDTAESGLPPLATQAPLIVGWATRHREDAGIYEASQPDPRTPFQLEHGCVLVIEASTAEELVGRCLAQWTLAELLAAAESAPKRHQKGAIHAAWHAYGVLMERVLSPREAE